MTVRGELDFANTAVLADVTTTLLERDPGGLIVDISKLRFADAASMTLFLASCDSLAGQAIPVRIVGATLTVRRACHAAGLGALLAGG
jgi:anti-anti-sigma factor